MKPAPSLEQLIASVPPCPVQEAIDWLEENARDVVRPFNSARWISAENVFLSEDDVIRRYRLARAKFNRRIVQGVG